jgi:hypothetical protein
MHFDIRYQIVAGQLSHESDLNYVEHNVVLNLDLDRWLERHTNAANIDITLAVDTSPSLPSLQADQTASSDSPFGGVTEGTGSQDMLSANQGGQDLLNLREDRSGYGLRYGLTYRDRVGPMGTYKFGWLVRDNRYEGGVIRDQAALDVNAGYSHSLLRGEAGFTVDHKRFVRGGNKKERTFGFSGNYSQMRFASSWGVSLGTSYRTDSKALSGRGGVHASRRGSRVKATGRYSTDLVVTEVGVTSLKRRHHLNLNLSPARNSTGSVFFVANGSWASDVKRSEVSINRVLISGDKSDFYAEIGYKWANLWWDDPATSKSLKSRSNVIGFNFIWRFL